jgi:hypothetical protein
MRVLTHKLLFGGEVVAGVVEQLVQQIQQAVLAGAGKKVSSSWLSMATSFWCCRSTCAMPTE